MLRVLRRGLKPLHLVFSALLMFTVSLTIHEYSHFAALILLGGRGYIEFNYCVITQPPPSEALTHIVCFMGGIGSGLFFLLMRLIEEDPEDKVIETTVAVTQIIYGVGEGLNSIYGVPLTVGAVASIIGASLYIAHALRNTLGR